MQETVNDVMSKKVIALLPSDSVRDAAKLMSYHNIGSIPVVSGGELKGIITDRDIVIRCIAQNKSVDNMHVSELMSTDITFVTPDQTVHDAISLMASEQIRRLPVIRNGFIDGMISLSDIARLHAGPEIASAISEISRKDFTSDTDRIITK